MSEVLDSLKLFHALVKATQYRAEKQSLSGLEESMHRLGVSISRVRHLANADSKCRIGVFGPPKRGKSSILNVFIGADILPSGPMPKTRCVIEIHNIAGTDEPTEVRAYTEGGGCSFYHFDTNEEYKDAIESCFQKERNVERIEVFGDFSSSIMPDNSILIDTPGAENAFDGVENASEDETHRDTMGEERGKELAKDTERALNVLDQVDIPLFCMRGDQSGSESERRFYQKYMHNKRPINIINFKDKCDDDEDAAEVFNDSVGHYGLVRRETVFVSARKGKESAFKGKMPSEESGFIELSNLIKQKLNSMPLECLKQSMYEYKTIISAVNAKRKDRKDKGPKIHLEVPKPHLLAFLLSLDKFPEGKAIKDILSSLA